MKAPQENDNFATRLAQLESGKITPRPAERRRRFERMNELEVRPETLDRA